MEHAFSRQLLLIIKGEQVTIVNMVNKHSCAMCVKSFTYPSQLDIHLLTHSEVKLYNCEQCAVHQMAYQAPLPGMAVEAAWVPVCAEGLTWRQLPLLF